MKKNINNSVKFKKMMCIVIIAILFITNTVFYIIKIRNLENLSEIYTNYVIDNFARHHITEISNIENTAFSMLYSPIMDKLISSPSDSSTEGELLQMIINSIELSRQNNLINDAYVFIRNRDICLSSSGLYQLEMLYNNRFRKYFETFTEWEKFVFSSKVKEYKYVKSSDENNKLFFLHTYVSRKMEQPVIILIDINIDKFNVSMQKNLSSADENVYILNVNGDIVFNTSYNSEIHFSKIEGLQSSKDKKYVIKSMYSPNNMWKYIYVTPRVDNSTYHIIFILFYLLIFIIGKLKFMLISKEYLNTNVSSGIPLYDKKETLTNRNSAVLTSNISILNGNSSRFEQIINFIDANYSNKNLNVGMIADELGITPNYLSACFKKETGKSLYEFITKYRIEVSKKFLDQNLIIKEVASIVGFNDANVYIRAFKKFEGMTPGQYRAKREQTN